MDRAIGVDDPEFDFQGAAPDRVLHGGGQGLPIVGMHAGHHAFDDPGPASRIPSICQRLSDARTRSVLMS